MAHTPSSSISDRSQLSSQLSSNLSASPIDYQIQGANDRSTITINQVECYRNILKSHIAHTPGQEVGEELVRDILLKSGLEEEIIENVWEQTSDFAFPIFDPAQEGAWTELEMLVALHLVQGMCGIDHTRFLQNMAGTRPYERSVQRARSSYAMVRNRTRLSPTSEPPTPPVPGVSISPRSMTPSYFNSPTQPPQASTPTLPSPQPSHREPLVSSVTETPQSSRSSSLQPVNSNSSVSGPTRNDSEKSTRSPLAPPAEPAFQFPPQINVPRMPGSWASVEEPAVRRTTSRASRRTSYRPRNRSMEALTQPGLEVAVPDGIEVLQYQPYALSSHTRQTSRSQTPRSRTPRSPENQPSLEVAQHSFEVAQPSLEVVQPSLEVVQPSLEVVEPPFDPYTATRPVSPVLDPYAYLRGPEIQPSLEVATPPGGMYQTTPSAQPSPRISPYTQFPEAISNPSDPTFEMAQPPTVRRYDIQRRLSQLSVKNVPARRQYPPLENLVEAPSPCMDVLAATREDRDAAHHYLTGLRLRDPNYKAPSTLFKSKKTVEKMTNPENFVFSQSEKNRAFDLAIARNEPGGLIAALIEMGAQINVVPEASSNNLNYKKLLGKREEDQRSDALKTVACNRRLDLVRLVACQGVDQDSRDSALLEVTRSMYPDIVRELLFRRANPNAYEGKILESAVSCKKEDIVRMLLQAPVTLDQRYATNSLPVAVKGGDLSIVQSLAEFGADVNHQKGVCLQMAVRMGRVDILLVLLRSKPSTENLNAAAALVLDDTTHKASRASKLQKYELLECLLCSGAGGEVCEGILERAVTSHHLEVVALLLSHDVTVRSKSLEMSVSNCRIPMLRLLLEGSYDKACLPKLLERIPSTAPNKVHYEITKSLLAAGAKGRNLSVALVKATLRKDTETASMLIDYQASVNYNEAQALQIAVKSGNVNMLHVLLTGRPSKDSVNFAFPLIPRNDRAFKLSMTLLLLRNGASGHAVSTALVEAVSDRTEVHDIDLIETLLEHKADPNFRDGQALQIAARRANKEILSLILRYKPKIETVSQAVTATMDIRSANECCETLRILLQHGATGPTVSQALHVALERSPAFDNVAKLLLEHKANPNHAEGKAVLTAVTHCTPELLSAILATGLSKQGVRSKAFTAAFSSGTKEKVKKIEILLHAGISSTAISDGLIHEVELNQPNLSIVRLLIQHGADVNYQKGRVIQSATTSGNVALLSQLVANQVTKETLLHAIPLSMDLKLHKTRSDVLAVLLKTTQNVFTRSEIRVTDEFGAAVITEVERSDPSRSILEQLLEAGASASFNGGQAIQYATSNGNVEVLEMLVAKTASANMLGKAIPQASSFPSKSQRHKLMKLLLEAGAQGTPVDEALVKAVNDSDEVLVNLLLEHNASIDHNGGQCVLDAVKNGRGKVLDSLLRYLPSQATVDATFGLILEPLKNGKKDTGLLRIILQYHPSTPLISSFLEESIPGAVDVPGRYMVHLLLDAGASVDYHGGAALKHATRKGDIELLQKMLNMKPRAETVSNAFLEVFDCDGDQQSLLKMLDLFLTCHCPPALEAYARDQTNPLVLALTQQSHAPEIAEMLLTAGCSADCLFESSLERKSFPEPVTPLLWLLRQESASTKCRTLVTALLKAGANPNFRSPALNKTPLILAAQHQNLNVVTELLAFEAEFSTEDSSGRTPLSYAAEAGDFAIMQALIRAGAPANDESLHFAARGCQVKCVQLLLEHGADINFPSTRNGLTPLGELCLNGAGGQLIKQPLKYTLRILLTANPDLNVQAHGKSILLLALDNPKPVDMTKALLEAGIRNSINDDVHLYISNKQHCYSPTMYVKQGINRADPEHMNELLRVLQMFGCKDRFWNSGPGSQPPGACGYPPDIKRRVDEEDRMDKIRRTAEERQAQLEKERREEEELIRRRDEAEERRLERARQMHQLQRDNLNVRY